jgi:outer membrane protein assembly factor BamD (BamD/ComL family)
MLRTTGRFREAYDAFAELPLLHPRSYLADRAFFEAAEIQERDLSDAEAAVKLYSRLLSEYPGSLLAPEARERIRRLRGNGA